MKILDALARRFGRRPLFVAAALLLAGLILCFRLTAYVRRSRGIGSFDTEQSVWLMRLLILLAFVILAWRLMSVNRKLRGAVIGRYRKIRHLQMQEVEKRIRKFVSELDIRGNIFKRMLRLIEWAPKPFFMLVLVLVAADSLFFIADLLEDFLDPQLRAVRIIYANIPWGVATFIAAYLVYNDIWVFDEIEALLSSLLDFDPPAGSDAKDRFASLDTSAFKQMLTPKEREVLQMRLCEGRSLKEIAAASNKEPSTVKTQINDINGKWRRYTAARGLSDIPLKDFYCS